MIVIGYQGIGKSTLAKNANGYIDLESGNFFVDEVRPDDWYRTYCQIAHNLSEQGYVVFVSSHKVVRDELRNFYTDDLLLVYPALALKDEWVEKLRVRWEISGKEKDYKAYMNAADRYDENIQEMSVETGFVHVVLYDMNYDLAYSIWATYSIWVERWMDGPKIANKPLKKYGDIDHASDCTEITSPKRVLLKEDILLPEQGCPFDEYNGGN